MSEALETDPANRGFSEHLWNSVSSVYTAILAHPFVRGLTDATLPRDRFQHYVVQDALYLREFARVLSSLASKAPREESVAMFNRHASDSLAVEQALHEGFLRDFGMHREQLLTAQLTPTNQAYCSYLHAIALSRPYHEGLGAVLPCYWIYQRVGASLLPLGSPDPLYRRWLDTYGSPEFDTTVREVLAETDRVSSTLAQNQLDDMRGRFMTASRYEWMFWDAAWRLETWPV